MFPPSTVRLVSLGRRRRMKTLARRLSKSRSSADRYGTFDELRAPVRGGSTGGPKHPDLVTVEVPAGAQPGQQLKVKLPSGQSVMVTLPPNVQAGSLLQLSVETQWRIAVRLPPTVQPGQMLTARAPDGTTVMFHAPAAARSGLRIQVALPSRSQKGQRFLNVVVPPEYCHGQQLSARRQAQSAQRPSPSWRRSSLPSPRRRSGLPWSHGRGPPGPRAALRTGRAAQPPRAQMPRLRCGRVARPKQRDPILRLFAPQVLSPTGQRLVVRVPPGTPAGTVLRVQLPEPPTKQVVAAALSGGGCSPAWRRLQQLLPAPSPAAPSSPFPAAPVQQPLPTLHARWSFPPFRWSPASVCPRGTGRARRSRSPCPRESTSSCRRLQPAAYILQPVDLQPAACSLQRAACSL